MVNTTVIKKYGGTEIQLKTEESIFREGDESFNYFQIASFGEPPLLYNFHCLITAIAIESTVIISVAKDDFFNYIEEASRFIYKWIGYCARDLKHKSMVLSEKSFYDLRHRITSLLKYLKTEAPSQMKGRRNHHRRIILVQKNFIPKIKI